ncbi:MAG TPA: hypothetical protein VJ970_05170, partial [Flavobacteriaceae bacterium]|nr:hypothetical protein [Flavobacteriaceae bacterium]
MTEKQNIKEILLQKCFLLVNEKLNQIEAAMASLENDLLTATKSSAGDKHETGRAMIQLEMEKLSQQLVSAKIMHTTLGSINYEKKLENVRLGSLVVTTKDTYFLAVSLGKIELADNTYLVVSAQSPIGKSLLGKQIGD